LKPVIYAGIALVLLMGLAGAASATSYTLTVQTNSTSYSVSANVLVSGQVTPAP